MGVSFSHARDLVSAERSLGLLIEPSVQHWAVHAGWPAEVARWGYANLHFKGSCLMLAVLYFGYRRQLRLRPQRRLRRDGDLGDRLCALPDRAAAVPAGAGPRSRRARSPATTRCSRHPGDALFNPFAAVPSMHVGLSVILAWSLAMLVRPRRDQRAALRLSAADDLRGGRQRQPFLAGRRLRRCSRPRSRRASLSLLARLNPDWSFGGFPRRSPSADVEPQPEPEAAPA